MIRRVYVMKKKVLVMLICSMLFCLVGCDSSCKHKYGDWSNTKEAGCVETGIRSRTCSKCGNVETDEIPAQGHNFVNGVCTECGDSQ